MKVTWIYVSYDEMMHMVLNIFSPIEFYETI